MCADGHGERGMGGGREESGLLLCVCARVYTGGGCLCVWVCVHGYVYELRV